MDKPVVRFGILSFDWRGFAVGIFDRMSDGTMKLIEHKLSDATSVDDFAAFIAPYKVDGANPLKAVFMNRNVAFQPIAQVLGGWIKLHQVREIKDISDSLTLLSMRLNDGKILMAKSDGEYFAPQLKRATVTEYCISINMLLILVNSWDSIQNIGVPEVRERVY